VALDSNGFKQNFCTKNSIKKPRLFEKGTTVRFNTKNGRFNLVSSSNGFLCKTAVSTNSCSKGTYNINFNECGEWKGCGTDSTTFNLNTNTRTITTSFGLTCIIDVDANLFRCR